MSTPSSNSSSIPIHTNCASYKIRSTTASSRKPGQVECELDPVAEGSLTAHTGDIVRPTSLGARHSTVLAPTSTSRQLRDLLDSFNRFAQGKSGISASSERIIKTVLIFIGKPGCKAECAEFSGVGPNEYELLEQFFDESGLKPKLSYITEESTLIVEMPSAIHEAALVPLNDALICFFNSIDFDSSIVNVRVLCNTETSSINHTIPDLRVSLQGMMDTEKEVFVSVLGETTFSQHRRSVLKKFRNAIALNPGLLMAIMAEIQEINAYRSPTKKSCAAAMLREKSPRSSNAFNAATGTLPALHNPVKVEGHTWCSIGSIAFKVWVRGMQPIDIDTTDRNLVACGTLYPVEDMGAAHAMIQKGVREIREQLIRLYQKYEPGIDADAMRAPPFILRNNKIVTAIAGSMSETAHRRYTAWYTQNHLAELAKHDAYAAHIYSQGIPVFHMTLRPRVKLGSRIPGRASLPHDRAQKDSGSKLIENPDENPTLQMSLRPRTKPNHGRGTRGRGGTTRGHAAPTRGVNRTLQHRPNQLSSIETQLMQSVKDLQGRNRVFGTLLTIDELLDPAEEKDKGEFSTCDGGESSIADEVCREILVANGGVIEVDSDDDKMGPSVTRNDVLDLCQQLEAACMQYGDPQISLDSSSQLRNFRANLRREELHNAKQTCLEQFYVPV
ncbi:hypothetical protein BDR07DRAFT_1488639 [Suillus spraguei]|nr:hypothetical protein BDR07DRAFT_1488639 [Suillus spraguei]